MRSRTTHQSSITWYHAKESYALRLGR